MKERKVRAKSVTIDDTGWKWLLAGILGLTLIFAWYGLSQAMGVDLGSLGSLL